MKCDTWPGINGGRQGLREYGHLDYDPRTISIYIYLLIYYYYIYIVTSFPFFPQNFCPLNLWNETLAKHRLQSINPLKSLISNDLSVRYRRIFAGCKDITSISRWYQRINMYAVNHFIRLWNISQDRKRRILSIWP